MWTAKKGGVYQWKWHKLSNWLVGGQTCIKYHCHIIFQMFLDDFGSACWLLGEVYQGIVGCTPTNVPPYGKSLYKPYISRIYMYLWVIISTLESITFHSFKNIQNWRTVKDGLIQVQHLLGLDWVERGWFNTGQWWWNWLNSGWCIIVSIYINMLWIYSLTTWLPFNFLSKHCQTCFTVGSCK